MSGYRSEATMARAASIGVSASLRVVLVLALR